MRLRKYAAPLVGFTAVAAMVHVAGCAGNSSSGFPAGDDGGSSSGSSSGGFSSGSGTSSGGTSTSSSGGFSTSSSGSSTSSSGSSTSSSGSTSGGVTSGSCAPASTGGLALAMNYLAAPANPGTGGYAFSYQDPVGSDVCLDGCPASGATCTVAPATSMLCTQGTLLANPAPYAAYGGGIGFNLNQPMATGATAPTAATFMVPAAATGLTYAVTSIPANGLRIQIDHTGTQYCAPVTSVSGTITWAELLATCYDTPPGAPLAGPPSDATQIQFQMVTTATAGTGDFCVTAISFAQ